MAQWIKSPPAVQETPEMWVRSLGQENPLEKKMATRSMFLPEKSHGQRSLAGYSPKGHKESGTTERLSTHILQAMCGPYYVFLVL